MRRVIHPAFPSSHYLQRVGWFFRSLFLGFGGVLFFLAFLPWLWEVEPIIALKLRGGITTGTVTGFYVLHDTTAPRIYITYYQFDIHTPQHETRHVKGEVQQGIRDRYQIDQPVAIIYLPDDPSISKPLSEFPFSSVEIYSVVLLFLIASASLAGFLILEAAVLRRLRIARRLETRGRFGFGRIVELPEAASTEIIYEYGPSHLIRQAMSPETYPALQVGDLVVVRYLDDNPAHACAEQGAVRLITVW